MSQKDIEALVSLLQHVARKHFGMEKVEDGCYRITVASGPSFYLNIHDEQKTEAKDKKEFLFAVNYNLSNKGVGLLYFENPSSMFSLNSFAALTKLLNEEVGGMMRMRSEAYRGNVDHEKFFDIISSLVTILNSWFKEVESSDSSKKSKKKVQRGRTQDAA